MVARKAAIAAVASYLPEGALTNEQLARDFGNWDAAKILEKTGIGVRRIASESECSSDLGVAAARALFGRGLCKPEDVEFLVFCTQSPDHFLPATACLVQERLGLPTTVGAIDFNQGCSGFVMGLALAKGLVESGMVSTVLLITAETYSKFLNPRDRSVRTIFGDGAAATVIRAIEAEEDLIGPFVFGTDGRGGGNLIVPAGAMRRPPTPETAVERQDGDGNWRSLDDLYMNGPEIFNFTLRAVPQAVASLLQRWGKSREEIDLFIFHQANRFMLERLRAKLAIPVDRFWLDMEFCANTVSSTIPIAWDSALRAGRLKTGDTLMLVGFGVGYSWAAAMARCVDGG